MHIELRGAVELQASFSTLFQNQPDELNKAIRKAGKGWCDDVNQMFPSHYAEGKKPFAKSWKTKTTMNHWGIIESLEIVNKRPHWHLVENGHAKVLWGKRTGGFVPGKHYARRAREIWKDKFPEAIDAAITAAMAKAGLA